MPENNEVGTKQNPITSKSPRQALEKRGGKYCLCDGCGQVHRCTPSHDYYLSDTDGKLRCPRCFGSHIGVGRPV